MPGTQTLHNDVVPKLNIGTIVNSQVHSLRKICRTESSEENIRRKFWEEGDSNIRGFGRNYESI
jgi:hypothetical protein